MLGKGLYFALSEEGEPFNGILHLANSNDLVHALLPANVGERAGEFFSNCIPVNLTSDTINAVASILDARVEANGTETILYVGAGRATPAIVVTLSALSQGITLVSAQTVHGYFELHAVQRFVPVDPDEVIFVAEAAGRISGLVVGREGTCSLFANVDHAILSADLTQLDPPLLLSSMQLGLTEQHSFEAEG